MAKLSYLDIYGSHVSSAVGSCPIVLRRFPADLL